MLVARRQERLAQLAGETRARARALVAVDLTDEDAPQRVRAHVLEHHDRLDLLVNNAGAVLARDVRRRRLGERRSGRCALNFDAQVRLTEALLPLLRRSAPSAIVNVSSTAGRVARPGSGAYSASKFALAGWTDALWAEERPHGVHVGLVLPGLHRDRGFPGGRAAGQAADPLDRLDAAEAAAEAIYEAGIGRRARTLGAPRLRRCSPRCRTLAPGLTRRIIAGGAGATFTTATGADAGDAEAQTAPLAVAAPVARALVAGATGFIGGRLAARAARRRATRSAAWCAAPSAPGARWRLGCEVRAAT